MLGRRRVATALTLLWLVALLGCRGHETRGPERSVTALIEQAEAAEAARRYDRARALYQQAKREAKDAPSRALAARAYGRALIFWGEYDKAVVELEEAAGHRPGDAGAWHDLGMVRHHLSDPNGAETAFRRSIAAQPRDPRSRIALAALLWQEQRLEDALREYQALGELDLPPTIRDKVAWAIRTLRQRLGTR